MSIENISSGSLFLGISIPLFLFYLNQQDPIGFTLTLILALSAYANIKSEGEA